MPGLSRRGSGMGVVFGWSSGGVSLSIAVVEAGQRAIARNTHMAKRRNLQIDRFMIASEYI